MGIPIFTAWETFLIYLMLFSPVIVLILLVFLILYLIKRNGLQVIDIEN